MSKIKQLNSEEDFSEDSISLSSEDESKKYGTSRIRYQKNQEQNYPSFPSENRYHSFVSKYQKTIYNERYNKHDSGDTHADFYNEDRTFRKHLNINIENDVRHISDPVIEKVRYRSSSSEETRHVKPTHSHRQKDSDSYLKYEDSYRDTHYEDINLKYKTRNTTMVRDDREDTNSYFNQSLRHKDNSPPHKYYEKGKGHNRSDKYEEAPIKEKEFYYNREVTTSSNNEKYNSDRIERKRHKEKKKKHKKLESKSKNYDRRETDKYRKNCSNSSRKEVVSESDSSGHSRSESDNEVGKKKKRQSSGDSSHLSSDNSDSGKDYKRKSRRKRIKRKQHKHKFDRHRRKRESSIEEVKPKLSPIKAEIISDSDDEFTRTTSRDERSGNNYDANTQLRTTIPSPVETNPIRLVSSNPSSGNQIKRESEQPDLSSETKSNEKVNMALSGKLTDDSNTYNGIVIKYAQPPEARKPKRRWRWYIFKGEQEIPFLPLHRQSAYLIGRERKVADIPTDHPSCSKQHAVLQYRLVSYTREDGSTGRTVKPYVLDLGSANGTYVNFKRIDPQRYVELLEKDVVKFGYSSREYVLLHEASKGSDLEDDELETSLSPVSLLRQN